MGRLSELDAERQMLRSFELEELVSAALNEPDSAEVQIERKIDSIIRELDELVAMSLNNETVDLVEGERVAVGQIIRRSELLGKILIARQPSRLKVVQHA